MSDKTDYDVLIIGGGLVGASLACALSELPLRVAVVEARAWDDNAQPSFDARSVALAYTSKQVFSALSLWPAIEALGVAPIRNIHVSDRGHPGLTHLRARDYQLDALGYVVETRVLGQVLWEAMAAKDQVDVLCPAQLEDVRLHTDHAQVDVIQNKRQQTLTSRLLVAADGGDSQVRKILGVGAFKLRYEQCAVIANIRMDHAHGDTAFERFTDNGPLALLPLRLSLVTDEAGAAGDCDYSLVWTQTRQQSEHTMGLSDEDFRTALQERVGPRAGRIVQIGKREVYPLGLMRSREQIRARLAIIGNAAHTLHPVAGQGFNLGLRDVAALAHVLADAVEQQHDPGSMPVLQYYAAWRRRDQLQVGLLTDSLVRLFSNNSLPLVMARNMGMLALDILPPLKRAVARQAMGFVGRLPRLARGLSLKESGFGQ